jgi:hypothetical protein
LPALLALSAAGLLAMGHSMLTDDFAALRIKSGLCIGIGNVDGSVCGDTRLRDLSLSMCAVL